jgi:phytoene dehydrogenase-like protein
MSDSPIVIVGAGAAGLACARVLQQRGLPYLVVDGADRVGGRLATDHVDGFALDRGFQILLTSYPEVKRFLDLPRLQLGQFRSGAYIRKGDGFVRFPDPLKQPWLLHEALFCPVGTLADRFRVARYGLELLLRPRDPLNGTSGKTSAARLQGLGFSPDFYRSFLQPFFAGVFLDEDLDTDSVLLDFLFLLFGLGRHTLPAGGMQRVGAVLAEPLAGQNIRLNTAVQQIGHDHVLTAGGERIDARQVVLATDGAAAHRLLNTTDPTRFHATCCTYFAAPASPLKEPYLALNPNRDSPVHHLAVFSDVAQGYAPPGQALICVTHVGHARIPESDTQRELRHWFGPEVDGWRHLRTYLVEHALPHFPVGSHAEVCRRDGGIWQCGDWFSYPALNAALQSGREVGERLLT